MISKRSAEINSRCWLMLLCSLTVLAYNFSFRCCFQFRMSTVDYRKPQKLEIPTEGIHLVQTVHHETLTPRLCMSEMESRHSKSDENGWKGSLFVLCQSVRVRGRPGRIYVHAPRGACVFRLPFLSLLCFCAHR